MFLDSWSLALSICSLIVLFLVLFASRTAFRVLRFWDPSRDDNRQIRLENEIWLTSTLVQYTLAFQIFSLVLFVLAADKFCTIITGAMCATGSLLANPYGIPALLVKLAALFFYGFWIALHKLDIRSPHYPLVRIKYWYFLLLLPLLFTDITLQTLYLARLSPDIITSCCGVVFDTSGSETTNLLPSGNRNLMIILFYTTVSIFLLNTFGAYRYRKPLLYFSLLPLAILLLIIANGSMITVFSSYIYSMPYHHCPFCILKPEYHYIGFFLYGFLFTAAFLAMVPGIINQFGKLAYLEEVVAVFQQRAVLWAMGLIFLYTAAVSFFLVIYRVVGGEI
jgi:hypothetical protein